MLGTVAEDEPLSIASQTPPLAGVPERSTRRETGEVVDEGNIGSSRQLHELALPFRQPLGKIGRVETVLLDHLSRFELDFPERRLTIEPRALKQESLMIDEALCVRGRVVRVGIHHAKRVDGCSLLSCEFRSTAGRQPRRSSRQDEYR